MLLNPQDSIEIITAVLCQYNWRKETKITEIKQTAKWLSSELIITLPKDISLETIAENFWINWCTSDWNSVVTVLHSQWRYMLD